MTATSHAAPGHGSHKGDPILRGRNVVKHFPIQAGFLQRTVGHVQAVDGVDIDVRTSETLGLVGESGSGKSTLGRCLVRLHPITSGEVTFDGVDISKLSKAHMRPHRREMQMVFQDPYSSMDPSATIADSLEEPLRTHHPSMSKAGRHERISALLETVGLQPGHRQRYPREFSGGQLQRIAIARALILDPKVIVLDEPVSSLDVSIQASVINLLDELQQELALTYLFIAHDLALVRHISDRIAVMYLGRIVEEGPAEQVYTAPRHPYTQALLSAIPEPNPRTQRSRQRIVLEGDIPSPAAPPSGCRFHTRCPHVMDICRTEDPAEFESNEHRVFCHLHTSGPTLQGESLVTLPTPASH